MEVGVGEHRVIVVAGRVETLFGKVGVQQCCRVVAEGDVTGFAAFAGQGDHGRALGSDVSDGKVGKLLGPGCAVVEGGEQGRVAPSSPGGPVGLGEQAAGLLHGQVVHG